MPRSCNDLLLQNNTRIGVQIVQIVFQVSKHWCPSPFLCLKLTGSTFCSAAKKAAKRVKCDILARRSRSEGTWVETKAVQERKKALPKVEPREPLSQKEGKVFLNIGTQSTLVQICAYVLQYYCNTFLKGIRMQGGCFKSYMLWGCLNGPVLVAEEL